MGELLFNSLAETRHDKALLPASGNVFDNDAANQKIIRLHGNVANTSNKRVGPRIVLKVMAGDAISISTQAWYQGSAQAPPADLPSFVNELAGLLTNGILSNGGDKSGTNTATAITDWVTPILTGFENNKTYDNSKPKAYLNWVIVDEEFKEVLSSNHKGAIQVNVASGNMKQLLVGLNNLTIRRNGWLYVYLSNESNQNVYFDDLIVNHKRGPVVAAQDYFPFGMEIAGLSTKAIGFGGESENRNKFNKGSELQSKEFSDGSGLEWYSTDYRMYDPQIGRWHVIDPKPDYSQSLYLGMGNNPIRFNDPLGDTIRHSFRTGFLGIFGKKVSVDYNNGKYNIAGTNTEYTGKLRSFGKGLLNDLTALSNNSVSSGVVTELQNYNQVIKIGNSGSSGLDLRDYINNGASTMILNFNRGESVESKAMVGGNKDNSPSYVKLFHELAHALQFKQLYGDAAGYRASTNQSAYYGVWYNPSGGGTQVVNSEKFSTHYENMLRASIPGTHLREYYSVEGVTPEPGRILRAGTRESLYHFVSGTTNPYVY